MRAELLATVENAYANNSLLYRHLETEASLEQIISYLYWDSLQPTFKDYIARWLDKSPASLKKELLLHIEEEKDHSRLFNEMMDHLMSKVDINTQVDEQRLETLNYTFSPLCVDEQSFGFFCGGFFATELMAGKRYEQLIHGLDRFGIGKDEIEFIVIHSQCESVHSMQALDDLVLPYIELASGHKQQVVDGINDRLTRSENYLRWYEDCQLKKIQ